MIARTDKCADEVQALIIRAGSPPGTFSSVSAYSYKSYLDNLEDCKDLFIFEEWQRKVRIRAGDELRGRTLRQHEQVPSSVPARQPASH